MIGTESPRVWVNDSRAVKTQARQHSQGMSDVFSPVSPVPGTMLGPVDATEGYSSGNNSMS